MVYVAQLAVRQIVVLMVASSSLVIYPFPSVIQLNRMPAYEAESRKFEPCQGD